jgi:xylulokinase
LAELLIGVDLGTTGTKTALHAPDGTTLATASAKTPLHWFGPGEVEQDPRDFVETAIETIAQCVRTAGVGAGDVAAIGITGQMAGTMGIDASGRPSTPYDSWLDLRCSPDVEALEREVGDELVRIAGCPAMVNHAPKIRWRRRERPEEFEATAAFLPPSAYVATTFAGRRRGFIDRSYLHFTGLADARAGEWSPLLAEAVGVPLEKLPEIVEPTTVIGELETTIAERCGLAPGIPIAAGLGDTAAGVLGAGVVRPGQLLDTAGTAAVLAISTTEHRPDTENRTLIVMRGALPGQWVALSYLSGGGLFDWLAAVLDEQDAESATPTEYERLGLDAERAAPGAEGLLFVPHLDGRLLPSQPEMRGAWLGLTRMHRREHLVRAVLESVAYEYSLYVDVMRELHPDLAPADVRVIGGGAGSDAWCRIKASVLGLPYVRLERDEFSCWGAALAAGAAAGVVGDLAEAALAATAVRDRFEPDPTSKQTYERMRRHYAEALTTVGALSRGLAGPEEVEA